MSTSVCTLCAGEGVDLSGSICECQKTVDVFSGFSDKICTFIPEQYANTTFSKSLLPSLKSSFYGNLMEETYNEIIGYNLRNTNLLITSPMKTGKTVFAYSAIRKLFQRGIPVVPYLDVLELKRIMSDIDQGKEYLYKAETSFDIQDIYTCPYLFVKMPLEVNSFACDAIAMIVDRRTRRGGSTIFFSHIDWEKIAKNDYNNTFKNLQGDGSFGTIKYHNFW